MKNVIPLIVLACSTFCAISTAEPEKKVNPIVGNWRWTHNRDVAEFLADGTVKHPYSPATWRELESKTVERKYQIVWKNGGVIDEATLDRNEKKLRIKNNEGAKFTVEKIDESKIAPAGK